MKTNLFILLSGSLIFYAVDVYAYMLSHFSHVLLFWDPIKCSPPGSSVHGILQMRILERVAIPFPGDLSDPGIESASPALAGTFFTTEPPGKPSAIINYHKRSSLNNTNWSFYSLVSEKSSTSHSRLKWVLAELYSTWRLRGRRYFLVFSSF